MSKGCCGGRQIGACLRISVKMPESSHCVPCVVQHHFSAKRWCFPLSIVLPCVAFSTSLRLTNFSTALSTTISSYVQSAALSHPWTLLVPPGKSHLPHQQVICTQDLLRGVSCALRNIHGQYIILINKTQIHGLAGLIRMVYVN